MLKEHVLSALRRAFSPQLPGRLTLDVVVSEADPDEVEDSKGETKSRDPASDEVVAAEREYASQMVRTIVLVVLLGSLVALMLGGLSWLSNAANNASAPISPSALSVANGSAALWLLLPISLALQVLLRMPRDSNNAQPEEDIAQRQFWGRVALVVAVAASFVMVSVMARSMIESYRSGAFDLVAIFGVPLGGAAAMLISADAVTLARIQGDKLRLGDARDSVAVTSLKCAIERIPGRVGKRPKVSLIIQWTFFATLGSICIGIIINLFLDDINAGVIFGLISFILSLFVILSTYLILTPILEKRILEALVLLIPSSFVSLVVLLSGMFLAMVIRGGDEASDFRWGVFHGALIGVPTLVVLAVTACPRGKERKVPPLLAVVKSEMNQRVNRLEGNKSKKQAPEMWETLSYLAMALSIVPFVGVALAAIATWERHAHYTKRRAPLVWAWVVVGFIAMVQMFALLLLPEIGDAANFY